MKKNSIKYLSFILSLFFIYFLFKKKENDGDEKSYDNSIDMSKVCVIKFNSNLPDEFKMKLDTCSKIFFEPFQVQLFNDDYGYEIELINIKGNYNYYYIYSVSTGRFKLIKYNIHEIQESDWCDNDSSGDSLIISSLNQQQFMVYDNLSLNTYSVNWSTKFDILTPAAARLPSVLLRGASCGN